MRSIKAQFLLIFIPTLLLGLFLSTGGSLFHIEFYALTKLPNQRWTTYYIAIFILLTFFSLIAIWLAFWIINTVIIPIRDLNVKIHLTNQSKQVRIEIGTEHVNASNMVDLLYKSFSSLTTTLTFANNSFINSSDTEALMVFAQAHQIFEEAENYKADSICLFNMANIHYRNGRYDQSINDYKQSLKNLE